MAVAEQFECFIPSTDALKQNVIYCSADASNAAALWGLAIDGVAALATLATVVVSVVIAVTSRREARAAEMKAESLQKERENSRRLETYLESLRSLVGEYPSVEDGTLQKYKASLIAIQGAAANEVEKWLGGVLQDMDEAVALALVAAGAKLRLIGGEFVAVVGNQSRDVKQLLELRINAWNRLLITWNYDYRSRSETEEWLEKVAKDLHADIEALLEGEET